MSDVRIGIVGVGNMGSNYARMFQEGKFTRARLSAVCDLVEARMAPYNDCLKFTDSHEMITSGEVDAVMVVTPHYAHTTVGIDALNSGLHVLVDKPISAHKADCERLIAAHKDERQVFAAMFNQRTIPAFIELRKLIREGRLGEIVRVNWIITSWFRSEAYCASGGWRATWKGEGGGVLLNQCPHQLDLLQWFVGMPDRVRAFCQFGKHHNIEVEDDLTAYLEYPDGATGVFVTSTGESPGSNRLEIAGDRGRVVIGEGGFSFVENDISTSEFSRTTDELWGAPGRREVEVPAQGPGGEHAEIIRNFVDAILDGAPLIARAEEGINSVELANSMLYSTLTDRTIDLPLDSGAYEKALAELVASSTLEKEVREATAADMSKSY
jgi:predicted dehydrogenase